MSITRLQQARQMYALGKLVERVGFRGGGMDMGNQSNQDQSAAMGGGNNNNNKGSDRPETTRHNPHTDSGTSKTSVATGDEMRSAARDFVQTLNHNNAIEAAKTGTKFSPYTGGASFTSTQRKGPSLFDLALFAAGPLGLFGKTGKTIATAVNLGKRAKTGLETVTSIADQFGFKNPIANMFSGNKTSTSKSKSTSKNNTTTNNGGDGEGLASLENQAGGYDEYILLLQKLQSGNISDSERNRYNVLKNMLGI
jgi:hypothetical protein